MTAARIAELNDHARTTLTNCRVFITPGIVAMDDLDAIMAKISAFAEFTDHNDPYGEHDFGVVFHGNNTVFWKIDCYDLDLCMSSPDPADPTVTARVLTVLLAEEY